MSKTPKTERNLRDWFRDHRTPAWPCQHHDDVMVIYRSHVEPFTFVDVGDRAHGADIHKALIDLQAAVQRFQRSSAKVAAQAALDQSMMTMFPVEQWEGDHPPAILHAGEMIERIAQAAGHAASQTQRKRGQRTRPGMDRLLDVAGRMFKAIAGMEPSERDCFTRFLSILVDDKAPALSRDTIQGYRRVARTWTASKRKS